MSNKQIEKCPGCGGPLERGFAVKSAPLSYARPDKFKKFAFVDEDLQRVGLLAKVFASPARYCPSFLCRACLLYIVNYGTTLSRRDANEAASRLETQMSHP